MSAVVVNKAPRERTLEELRAECRKRGMTGFSHLKKKELIRRMEGAPKRQCRTAPALKAREQSRQKRWTPTTNSIRKLDRILCKHTCMYHERAVLPLPSQKLLLLQNLREQTPSLVLPTPLAKKHDRTQTTIRWKAARGPAPRAP